MKLQTIIVTSDYTLNEDMYDAQLIVAADHIVIDGNGHYLIGSGSYEGVVVDGRTSVTVKNLKATNCHRLQNYLQRKRNATKQYCGEL
ncbi:MAG: hypothetical protein QW566_03080 [Candidatus Jordarchaeales archaeon]